MNRKIVPLFLTTLFTVLVLPALFSVFQQVGVVHAANITVNTFVDEEDGECIVDCSIRDAIGTASDGDTILIPSGTYPLSDTLGELSVINTLVFSGTGGTAADVILQAGANSRLFGVYDGTSTFYNLTLQNGNVISGNGGAINASGFSNLVIINSVITNNQTTDNGGGIAIDKGDLTLTNSQVVSNSAGSNGGGIYNSSGILTFTNSEVLTNTAVNNGGGVYVQLSNAEFIMNGGKINGNTADVAGGFPGGGVYVSAGTMTLNDGEIRGNAAFRGGGILLHTSATLIMNNGQIIDNEAEYGGGIYVLFQNATATINDGLISQNRSLSTIEYGGGGLYIVEGLVTMNGGEISQNSTQFTGGALEIRDELGRFVLNDGNIANNSAAGMGGAIFNNQGSLTVNGGTIHSNNSGSSGGAIATGSSSLSSINAGAILTNTAVTNGGGIYNQGLMTVTNSTFSGNGAGNGAAVMNGAGSATLTNVTISENSATTAGGGIGNSSGSLTVGNSIVYGNSAPSGADCTGSITSASVGSNISTCGGGDLNSDPQLPTLALNDGSNLNYALVSGSPAINSGDNSICTAADQRGNLRPVNICDIGAYEWGIAFFISDASLSESSAGSAEMSFIVSRSFMTNTTTTVDYWTVPGTATEGLDFTAVSTATLTFLPETIIQTVTVPILDDAFDEEDETFTMMLGNQSAGMEEGDFSGTGTILDDDEPLLTISDATAVSESDAATKTAVFTVTMSITSTKVITVDFTTTNGTATAGSDYTANSGTITFNPNDPAQTVEVTILDDALDENNEQFTVDLSNAPQATISDASGQAIITDDDAPVGMSIANASITEGNSGTKVMNFVVSLDAVSGKTVTVNYATANGTAVSGSDYVAKSGTLTFNPGDTQKTISISIKGDVLFEGAETLRINLSNGVNVTILDNQAVGTINNNDLGYFLPMVSKQ